MAMLTRDRVKPLLQAKTGPCISLYLPTHRHHPETEQDPIRFRNVLKQAERLLADRHPIEEIRALLDPVAALPNTEFWRHQADGLAIMRSKDVLEQFRLPVTVPELAVVADSFHVRPLIRCLNSNERYFLVAISQNDVRVYLGSMASLTPTLVAGLPESLAAVVGTSPSEASPGDSTNVRTGSARRAHPAGGTRTSTDEELVLYFRAIDRALHRALAHDPAPVILAGVEYYLPIYKQLTKLKTLADAIVAGSPDAMTVEELRTRAWPVAQGVLLGHQDEALAKYWRAVERDQSTDALDDIVLQAKRGRVRRLFLAQGVRVWGKVEATTGQVHRTSEQQGSQDDDLLDDVAEAVLANDGDVFTLPQAKMPNGAEAVAELR